MENERDCYTVVGTWKKGGNTFTDVLHFYAELPIEAARNWRDQLPPGATDIRPIAVFIGHNENDLSDEDCVTLWRETQ